MANTPDHINITIGTTALDKIAAIYRDAIQGWVDAYTDLVILTAYMAEEGHSSGDIAYAVEKPWKYAATLEDAKEAQR